MYEIGKKYLINTDNWFYAPNGKHYKAVYGTIKGLKNSEESLGIVVNSRSKDWYLEIGNMIIAGCQIHYAIQSNYINLSDVPDYNTVEGLIKHFERPSHIYNADI